jgi:glyoxylase I family protein
MSPSAVLDAELVEPAGPALELGVEHSQIKDRGYGSGVSFRDPDGIALEFFAPPS